MYVVITGATSGIGEALAYEFGSKGYNLILVGRRREVLADLQRKISQAYGVTVRGCQLNICNEVAVERFVKWIGDEQIKVGILINNAGVGQFGKFESYSKDKDEMMLETNIAALTYLTKVMLPVLESGSHILQVASTAAFAPGPYMAVYYASKSYVISFGLALRSELKNRGIKVSVLCPGPTHTPFIQDAGMEKAGFAKLWMMDAGQVAKYTYKGVIRNKAVIIPGRSNQLSVLLMKLCPPTIGAELVSMTQKKG